MLIAVLIKSKYLILKIKLMFFLGSIWYFENRPFKSKILHEATADSGFTIFLFTLTMYVLIS